MLRRILSILAVSFALALLCGPLHAENIPPTLAIGSPAPDFCLPGIDGKTHCLKDYSSAKVLVVIFTCDHCPTAQLYETRIMQLVDDFKGKSVAFVAIQPNNPKAIQLDELGYTDVSDSFAEMKIRAAYRHFNFPLPLRWRDAEDFARVRPGGHSACFRFWPGPQAALRRPRG
jgi:hypothetical protein